MQHRSHPIAEDERPAAQQGYELAKATFFANHEGIANDSVTEVSNCDAVAGCYSWCDAAAGRSTFSPPSTRLEHDKALARVIVGLMLADTELFTQFRDNESFRRGLIDTVFLVTYDGAVASLMENRRFGPLSDKRFANDLLQARQRMGGDYVDELRGINRYEAACRKNSQTRPVLPNQVRDKDESG